MPVIPFEVDSFGDFVPQSHSNTFATLEQTQEPYDVQVNNASNLSGTLENQINVDNKP